MSSKYALPQTRHPEEGWVEQDPMEMLSTVVACIDETCAKLEKLNVDPLDIKAIGGLFFL